MYEWAKVAFVTEIDGVIFIKCREQKKSATQKQEWSAQDFFFPHSQIDLTMPGNWKFDCFFFLLSVRAFSNKCKFEMNAIQSHSSLCHPVFYLLSCEFSRTLFNQMKKKTIFESTTVLKNTHTHTSTLKSSDQMLKAPKKKPHNQKRMRKKKKMNENTFAF